MLVDNIMSSPPVTVAPKATLREAARVLRRHRVGSVLVQRGGRTVGILTESDLVTVVAEGGDPGTVQVRQAMSSPVVTVEASAHLHDVAERMRSEGLKRLAVVRGEEVQGVVTVRDVAYAQPDLARRFHDVLKQGWRD